MANQAFDNFSDEADWSPDSGRHAYPRDLARAVRLRWHEVQSASIVRQPLPEPALLEHVLSVCYQASLLHEEGRPVTFRIAFGRPEAFAAGAGPPAALQRLVFSNSRLLDEHELRRLAPAAVFARSLIGATAEQETGPRIWGLIHSGPQWLQSMRGGRETQQAVPPVLMVAVPGPGRVLVSAGATTVAELSHGTLAGRGMDVFQAAWMEEMFGEVAARLLSGHPSGHGVTREAQARVEPRFGSILVRHVLRRVLATVRSARHGGTLIVVPQRRAADVVREGHNIKIKYGFVDEEPRRRIVELTVALINEFAGAFGPSAKDTPVGWTEYETSNVRQVKELDEALFEMAHLIADLTHVDGAVVMTDHLELLGFGGEIAGDLPETPTVQRARDLAGIHREPVRTDRVGTRHRSAYRLCRAMHDALAVVVSQDGGLRFIRWMNDTVTYWDQIATGPWEV